jgi:hypothetical protein
MSSIIMKRKIDLFKKLYKEIAGHGINGDTELAHINKHEAAVLKAMGGSGTVNNITGLREYWDDDDPAPAPAPAATTTVKQVSDLPEYFKPYVEELFSTAQDVYDRPYVPYGSELVKDSEGNFSIQKLPDIIDPMTGEAISADKRLADVSAEQKAAFAGLRDMFTQVDPETGVRSFRDPTSEGFKEATRLSERGARGFDELAEGEFQETYMSPYKQAVTDIQIKAAQEKQEAERKRRQGAARMANALGQGRYGVQEGMSKYYDQRLLDEIQKKGLQEAYDTGLKVFDADRLAARSGATQRAGLATDELTSGLKGLGALQSTGETQRAIAQQPLDIAYEEFARQQQFPKQNLQELSGILRGFQVQPTTYQTSQQYKPPQSLGQQLLAAGTLGAGISKGLGKSLLGAKDGGLMTLYNGGSAYRKRLEDKFSGPWTEENKHDRFKERLRRLRRTREAIQNNPDMDEGALRVLVQEAEDKLIDDKIAEQIDIDKREDTTANVDTFKEIESISNLNSKTGSPDIGEVITETAVTESTPSDSDSGWDIRKILEGFGEGFEAAAPYLASYAKQKGWDDSAEGLKGISDAALKKAQMDYYKGLGLKASAYEAIERLKTNRALTKEAVATEIKTIELRLKDLQAKEEFTGLEDDEKIERDGLIRALEEIRIRFGAFPASTSTPSGRATRESP